MSVKIKWQFGLTLFIVCTSCLVVQSKVFERCELAKVLHQRHRLGLAEVAQWVCIAQHSSGFNTAAQAGSLAGSSHGLFQISDVYWCSPPGEGAGCNLPCYQLRDNDLSDDLSCAKRIFDEHQRLFGDGYTAWNAYHQYCNQSATSYITDCFPSKHKEISHFASVRGYNSANAIQDYSLKKAGRVYERCELARELYGRHKIPMHEIPTWVCIAEHESHLNTATIGRLNSDGSADHGIFQISDLYWCSHDRFGNGRGKACGLPCTKLLDNDITDDVQCVQRIFNEHAALSGDGFNAWSVYKPYCQNQGYEKIASCFQNYPKQQLQMASNQLLLTNKFHLNNKNPFFKALLNIPGKVRSIPSSNINIFQVQAKRKVYTRCSLAQELFFKFNLPIQDISTWVCIAEHESQLNTAALGRPNADDSLNYGLFQINDHYWCDHSEYGGKACNMTCSKLLDDDISDDVACIKAIFEEHRRLSGDGFNGWTVYKPHCQNQFVEHISTCFDEQTLLSFERFQPSSSFHTEIIQDKGKIYNKCELAQELYRTHRIPMEQIPKWVCIAQHESSFNTAAIGRLNADGSADHGLFQISDLYWCSHDRNGGKACNLTCDKLLDSDITDDIKCIRIIHEEHTRISGDGFNAWTVYKPHCDNLKIDHIKECFKEIEINQSHVPDVSSSKDILEQLPNSTTKTTSKGKVYKKCELTQELFLEHKIPIEQVATWVCIAQHESSFNTAAVGRLNADGSLDHGLFQISDLYWCSHDKPGGKACNIHCDKLLDSDIADDIQCIQSIYVEHTGISGDGFNAWTVYKPHCKGRPLEDITNCFSPNQIEETKQKQVLMKTNNQVSQAQQNFGKLSYSHNPFLHGLRPSTSNQITNYDKNSFLQNIRIGSGSEIHESTAIGHSGIDNTKQQNYRHNPFLNAPVILTLPHMLGASNEYTKTIRGLSPNAAKHQTFVDVQHLTGVPLQGGKRVQFNMFLKSINRITITENLSTVLMPAIWVEEGIELNGEMVKFFKKRLINTLKTLTVVHWSALMGGLGIAMICSIYYVVHRRKPVAVVEATLK